MTRRAMPRLATLLALALVPLGAAAAEAQLSFTALSPPCRVLDTRKTTGPTAQTGGQPLAANTSYNFTVQGNAGDRGDGTPCAATVPAGAVAVFVNATAVFPAGAGDIRLYPAGGAVPLVSTVNFAAQTTIPNGAIVPLAATTPDLGVKDDVSSAHFVVDVAGYFTAGGALKYYPLDPCRAYDTRAASGPTGGQPIHYGTPQPFTLQGRCGVPANAAAVVISVSALSPTVSGDLRVYPGTPAVRPLISSLNFNAGEPAIVNNVIMPLTAATPDMSVYADVGTAGTLHVLIDVTGYLE
jgi:hypothetical protein